MSLDAHLLPFLQSRIKRGIFRTVASPTASLSTTLPIDFSSNDYLSLASSLQLKNAFLQRLQYAPNILGSTGSRLLDGATLEHATLENRLACFFNAPAALLYTSGYDANVGFFSCVPIQGDVIIYDNLIHASVHDGIRVSRATRTLNSLQAFEHNSIQSLQQILQQLIHERPALRDGSAAAFIAVESLYSMDGDIAPLREICDTVHHYFPSGNGHIIVDEAHATGIYGPNGRGLVAYLGLEDKVTARLHTFGKALACSGAVWLTSKVVRDYLINYSRPQIFTTAMTHANILSLHCVFDMLDSADYLPLSERMQNLAQIFTSSFLSYKFPEQLLRLPEKQIQSILHTPIIPLLTSHAKPLAYYLQAHGFIVRPITHPTVPKGQDRVRVCIHAANTEEEITSFLNAIQEWCRIYSSGAKISSKL